MDATERELMNKVVKAQGRTVNAHAEGKRFVRRNGVITPELVIKIQKAKREYDEAVSELSAYRNRQTIPTVNPDIDPMEFQYPDCDPGL